jgi:hypothetical protein
MGQVMVASFINMLAAGWYCCQATQYRNKKARLETRERGLAADQARLNEEGKVPCLFPPRVYALTRQVLAHAVRAEMGNLVAVNLKETAGTCQLVVDQCVALADVILTGTTQPPWPPAEEDLRIIAAITTSGLQACGEPIAGTGPPAAAGDEAVYAYLSRVVVAGEPVTSVFPPGESFVLPVWTTAAMLVAFLPHRPWQAHLELIWGMTAGDGTNVTAIEALRSRLRRHAGH